MQQVVFRGGSVLMLCWGVPGSPFSVLFAAYLFIISVTQILLCLYLQIVDVHLIDALLSSFEKAVCEILVTFLPHISFTNQYICSKKSQEQFIYQTLPSPCIPAAPFCPYILLPVLPAKKVRAIKHPGSGNRSRLKMTCQNPGAFLSRNGSSVCFRVRTHLPLHLFLSSGGRNRDRGNLNQCHWQKTMESHRLTKVHLSVLCYFGYFSSP